MSFSLTTEADIYAAEIKIRLAFKDVKLKRSDFMLAVVPTGYSVFYKQNYNLGGVNTGRNPNTPPKRRIADQKRYRQEGEDAISSIFDGNCEVRIMAKILQINGTIIEKGEPENGN